VRRMKEVLEEETELLFVAGSQHYKRVVEL